jgi:hypothetical protein
MAGFGILMMYLFYAISGTCLAVASSVVLVKMARKRIPAFANGRGSFIWACGCAPFVGLLWVYLAYLGYGYVNGNILHQSNRTSLNSHAVLPNGYTIGSVNDMFGYISSPQVTINEYSDLNTLLKENHGFVLDIVELQLADPYILGKRMVWSRSNVEDYFLFDMRTLSVTSFATSDDLRQAASSKGIQVALEDLWTVYERYRVHWVDRLLPLVQLIGIVGLLAILWMWSRRLRARSHL